MCVKPFVVCESARIVAVEATGEVRTHVVTSVMTCDPSRPQVGEDVIDVFLGVGRLGRGTHSHIVCVCARLSPLRPAPLSLPPTHAHADCVCVGEAGAGV